MKNISFQTMILYGALIISNISGLGCGPSETTKKQVGRFLYTSRGIEEINKEASNVFKVFGTNTVCILKDHNKSNLSNYSNATNFEDKDFSAIFSLGETVVLLGGDPDSVPKIRIRFGAHSQAKDIYIFQKEMVVTDGKYLRSIANYANDSNYLQISSNIFILK